MNLSTAMNDEISDEVKIDKDEFDTLVAHNFNTSSVYHELLNCKDRYCRDLHSAAPFTNLQDEFLKSAIRESGPIVSFIMTSITNS